MWQSTKATGTSWNVCPIGPQAHPKPDMQNVYQYQHHSGQEKLPQMLQRL